MKKLKKPILFIALTLLCSCEETVNVDDATVDITEVDPPVSDCTTAPASWFTEVAGNRVTPAPNEGSTSVFANSVTVTNCDFHRWSWQKFLWLTNETNGVPFFQDNLTQVGPDGKTLGKGGAIILVDTGQASSSSDILKTTTDPATIENTVYYSIMVNDLFQSTMVKYGKMAHENINSIKDVAFPVGALETKSSWIAASALGDTSSYYITDGEIITVKDKDTVILNLRVALLGIHVVGVVENHPEFVWATFEHDGLAPHYDWDEATETTDATVTSPDDFPFFDSNDSATVNNINSGNGIYTNIFSLYKYGVPVEKSGDQTIYTATSQNGKQNHDNIDALNTSVKEQLKGVWNSYFYNGSLWINMENIDTPAEQNALLNTLSDSLNLATTGKLLRGSVSAYNITMETYVQAGFGAPSIHGIEVKNYVNCFYCHSANHNKHDSPLQISHLFNGYVSSLDGKNKAQIKEEHVSRIRAKAILDAIEK